MTLTFGSLFAGIGGIDLGLERAGMRCAWQVEIDDYAQRVLAKHWPDVARFRDVRECGAHNLAPVDVIAGGFPCQDISYAGRGAGLSGSRSGLWYEYARIVCELRPRYVLVENVAALIDRGLDAVLGTLASFGYDAEWECLPAAIFGAPHRRDRVFLVAYPYRERGQGGGAQEIFREHPLSRGENRRSAEEWRARSHLHTPKLCRSDDGVPHRVDRLRGLGNAVVPQVAEFVGHCIVAHAQEAAA